MLRRELSVYFIILINSEMPPKAGKKDKVCVEHEFSLRPKNSLCYYHNPLNIELCRRAPAGRGKKDGDCYEGPVFNRDRNCQTPTFVLASDRVCITLYRKSLRTGNQGYNPTPSMPASSTKRVSWYTCFDSVDSQTELQEYVL